MISTQAQFGVADPMDDVVPINPVACPFRVEIDYFNNLDYRVQVGFRDGIMLDLLPQNSSQVPKRLYITKKITYDVNKVQLHLPNNTLHEENQRIHEVAMKYVNSQARNPSHYATSRMVSITFQYCVDHEELMLHQCYYLGNLDLLVAINDGTARVHPQSPQGRYLRDIEESNVGDPKSFGLNVEIVTRKNSMDDKYINLNNEIYRVPVHVSNLRKPGVYIKYNGKTTLEDPPSPAAVDYYRLEDLLFTQEDKGKAKKDKDGRLIPFMLFNTVNEAMVYGDINSIQKHQLETMKNEVEMLKVEVNRRKIEIEQEQQKNKELQDQRKFFEEQMAQLAKQRTDAEQSAYERIKREQEIRALDRKDTSELMKWIPSIIGGVLALSALLVKSQK